MGKSNTLLLNQYLEQVLKNKYQVWNVLNVVHCQVYETEPISYELVVYC